MRIAGAAARLHERAAHIIRDCRTTMRQIRRALRAVLGFGRGMLSYPAAWFGLFRPRDELAALVAELLIVGFYGSNTRSLSARLLARQIRRGEVGGVFFVTQNIGTMDEVRDLLISPSFALGALIAVGGLVLILAIAASDAGA